MKATVIGLGLIGGSIALELKVLGYTVCGVDAKDAHAHMALDRGLVHKLASLEASLQDAELIVLATPVDASLKLLPQLLDMLSENQVLIDLCSTKGSLCSAVERHARRPQYVACHPMAGTEHSGPAAAVQGLFRDRFMVICERERSSGFAVAYVEALFAKMEMRTVYYEADEHDMHAAFVSHISHVSSFALALTVLDKEESDKAIFQLAAGGFTSTVRLAKSAPHTWVPIFRQNRNHLLEVMDAHMQKLVQFRDALERDDAERLESLMQRANEIKRIIDVAL